MLFSFRRNKKIVTVKDEMGDILNRFQLHLVYFERLRESQERFEMPYKLCKEITNIAKNGINISADDVMKIVCIYNRCIGNEDFDGSGWYDFKITLENFLLKVGYQSQWDSNYEKLEVTNRKDHKI